MKTAMLSLLLGAALVTATDRAKAAESSPWGNTRNLAPPPGGSYEIQVEYSRYRGDLAWFYWATYAGPYQSLSKAETVYDILAVVTEVGKLPDVTERNAVAVRLVYVIEPSQPDQDPDVYVIDVTNAPD